MTDERLYDDLASDYHLLFADWEASVRRQGSVLDALIASELGQGPKSILDCSCGIGTQSIGLALCGHQVTATDLSSKAVARARLEAERLGTAVAFDVCDVRELGRSLAGVFDVVLSCDNALPHLLSEQDLETAVQEMVGKTTSGGMVIASTRDYDSILNERPVSTPVGVLNTPEGKRISFQVWKWAKDGRTYEFDQVIGEEDGGSWTFKTWRGTYRAIMRKELSDTFERAGLVQVRWMEPADSGFFQPLILARKRGSAEVVSS
jgi:SAM-dependent methyltransferase